MSPRGRATLAIALGVGLGAAAAIVALRWRDDGAPLGDGARGPAPRAADAARPADAADAMPAAAAEPAAVRAGHVAVVGRVVDELAEPVRGCPVIAERDPGGRWLGERTPAPGATTFETRTGTDGRFALELPVPGPYALLLAAERFPARIAARALDAPAGTRLDVGELVLSSAVGLVVAVRAESTGLPLPDARVTLEPEVADPWLGDAARERQRRTARAGPEGDATLYGVAPGNWRLRVAADGRATRVLAHLQPDAATSVRREVRLGPGHALRGAVLAPDGTPVVGARVIAWPPAAGRGAPDDGLAAVTTETGPGGGFRLDGLAAGALRVRIETEAYPPLDADVAEVTGAGPLELRLAAGGALRGRVTAAGRPLAGARVEALPERGPVARAGRFVRFVAIADADGSFRLAGLPPGGCRLRATAADHLPLTTAVLDPHAPQREPLLLGLGPAGRVTGRVVDAAGAPLADASLRITDAPRADAGGGALAGHPALAPSDRAVPAAVRCDADGGFTLAVPRDVGEPFGVEVSAPDRPTRVFGPFRSPPSGAVDRLADLELPRGATLVGALTGPDGTGRGGERVTLVPHGAPAGRAARTVITDADGRFVATALAGGGWTIGGAFRIVAGGSAHVVVPAEAGEIRVSWTVE